MRVGILGSGLMGGKLGTIFARAGHEVVFSYARSSDKLKRLARDAQGNARARYARRGWRAKLKAKRVLARRSRRRKKQTPSCWLCIGLEWTMC